MGLVIGTGGIHIGTSGGGASPVKRFDAEAEYIKRKAGGTDNIGTGKAKIPTLKGKSVVWNQLVKTSVSRNPVYGITRTKVNNYTIHYSGTSTSSTNFSGPDNVATIVGHKYYVAGNGIPSSCWLVAISASEGTRRIATANTKSSGLGVYIPNGISIDNDVSFVCIDLTLMFGAGNEPATVEEFEAMYPLPYYEYNAGEIINNEAEAIETVGFNQWDEEWETGSVNYDTGAIGPDDSRVRSKNFILVLPNTNYCYSCNTGTYTGNLQICFYDSNYTHLGSYGFSTNHIFTTPSGAMYIKFMTGSAYGGTYKNDICINLSDAARNGQYEPYEKHTLQLGLDAFDVKDSEGNVTTVNGLKSAGSVFDEIDLARGKYIKRIGSVDLGTLNFLKSGKEFYSRSDVFPDGKAAPNTYNAIFSSYFYVRGNNQTDHSFAFDDSQYVTLYLRDFSYENNTAAEFKTAMSGVMLYYELATPIEYDLVTPIGNSYKVISGGTEERLPRDTASSVMAPIKYSVKYVQPKE